MDLKIKPLCVGRSSGIDKSILTYLQGQGERVAAPFIMWVIEGGDKIIVVDTGPTDPEIVAREPGREIKREPSEEPVQALRNIGIDPLDVEIVIATHLHWDHCGNFDLFPKAEIYVQRQELDFATAPLPVFGDMYEAAIFGHHPKWFGSNDRFRIVEGDTDVMPGLQLLFLPGHTPGLQGVLVSTESGRYCIPSDAVNLHENWDKQIPPGVHVNIEDCYKSFRRVSGMADHILPSHDMKVLEQSVYP